MQYFQKVLVMLTKQFILLDHPSSKLKFSLVLPIYLIFCMVGWCTLHCLCTVKVPPGSSFKFQNIACHQRGTANVTRKELGDQPQLTQVICVPAYLCKYPRFGCLYIALLAWLAISIHICSINDTNSNKINNIDIYYGQWERAEIWLT